MDNKLKEVKENINKKDVYFKSECHKYIFALLYTDTSLRQGLLGIIEEFYLDEKKAKEWRNKVALLIHPDNCDVEGAADAIKKLNDLYNRMVDRDE